MLCLLLLLRMPRTRVIYVTSTSLSETIIDYYLHLLPGVPGVHARRRLTLVSCDDASLTALTRKILERPQVIAQIAKAIPDLASAHMTCFTVSELERKLALALGLPIYGCNPSLLHWGSKSGSRKLAHGARRAHYSPMRQPSVPAHGFLPNTIIVSDDALGARLAVPNHPDVPALPQLIKQRCATAPRLLPLLRATPHQPK
jgi:hypothetical protein